MTSKEKITSPILLRVLPDRLCFLIKSAACKDEGSFEITSKGICGEPFRNSDHRNKDLPELFGTNY